MPLPTRKLMLEKITVGDREFWVRPDSTDTAVLKEVYLNRCYRKPSIGFEIEGGETWLDLGANIGAFAAYCEQQGARAVCYEPDKACFEVQGRNVPSATRLNFAVTTLVGESLGFYTPRAAGSHARGSIVAWQGGCEGSPIANRHVSHKEIQGRVWDGVKMDIEGSEFGIIDGKLLPRCRKLVMEYHSSRDRSVENLARRLKYLRSLFRVVSYVPEYDRMIAAGKPIKTFFDRLIFCMDPIK